jgi:FixJ family two-component response regulator
MTMKFQPCSLRMIGVPDLSRIPVIAVIDDDEIARDGTREFVESLGYCASAFASVDEFLESGQVHDTSCVITDVQMPGLNGIDLQDRLIARGHRIPIIFITGHPEYGARARAMKAGAVGYITKPYNVEHLISCLEAALRAS